MAKVEQKQVVVNEIKEKLANAKNDERTSSSNQSK